MRSLMIVLVLFSSSAFGQHAREIINRYLDTVSNGDIKNWDKIKSMYTEAESYYSQQDFEQKVAFLKADKPSFSKSYRVGRYKKRSDSYQDSTCSVWTSTFYFLKDKTVILMNGMPPLIKKPFENEDFYSDHLPVKIFKLAEKSESIELLGVKEFPIEGLLCYEIKIHCKGRNYLLYINTESFLLEYWNGRPDEHRSVLSKLYNYKKVDEFLIPMSDCLMRNGIVYYWSNKKKVEFNKEIDPALFVYKEK